MGSFQQDFQRELMDAWLYGYYPPHTPQYAVPSHPVYDQHFTAAAAGATSSAKPVDQLSQQQQMQTTASSAYHKQTDHQQSSGSTDKKIALREYQERLAAMVAPFRSKQLQQRTFSVIGTWLPRQTVVVKEAFRELGFKELPSDHALSDDPEKPRPLAIWGTGNSIEKHRLAELAPYGQKFNHFPCTNELGSKNLLYVNLNAARKLTGPFGGYDFFPRTYLLPKDLDALKQAMTAAAKAAEQGKGPNRLWILKPKGKARGIGIRVISSVDDLPKQKLGEYLVQQYLTRPLLIHGRKHTLRLYVAVTSWRPLKVYLLQEGFVHISSEPYSEDPDKIDRIRVHVTNPDVQGDTYWEHESNDALLDEENDLYWNLTKYRRYLDQNGYNSSLIWSRIRDVVVKTMLAVQKPMLKCVDTYVGSDNVCFEVWGLDVFVDQDGKPWLIEVNHTPSTNVDFVRSREIKKWMVRDLLAMMFPTKEQAERIRKETMQRLQQIGWLEPGLLPPSSIELLVQAETEYQLRGHYERLLPSRATLAPPRPDATEEELLTPEGYAHTTEADSLTPTRLHRPAYEDILLEQWVRAWIWDHDSSSCHEPSSGDSCKGTTTSASAKQE